MHEAFDFFEKLREMEKEVRSHGDWRYTHPSFVTRTSTVIDYMPMVNNNLQSAKHIIPFTCFGHILQ